MDTKAKLLFVYFPHGFFVHAGTHEPIAFVFGQAAVDVFADVFGYVSRQAFAVGFDRQQFSTAKAVFVDVFTEQCPQLAQCWIGRAVASCGDFAEIQAAPYIDTGIYD